MGKYNTKMIVLVILSMLMVSETSQAKVRTIQSRRDFERTVAKESMVVALFYDTKDKGLIRMYEDVSDYQMYDDADVIFLKLNAALKEIKDLSLMYGISTMPAFICFNKGKRVVDHKGSAIILSGPVSRDLLQSFIDTHYGAEIKAYIARKEERNKQRFSQENESWKPYFYPRDMFVPSYGPEERMLE
jgi:hypothetical protein